jgi:hypothetical protein
MKKSAIYEEVIDKTLALNLDESLTYWAIAVLLAVVTTYLVLQQPKKATANVQKSKAAARDQVETTTPVGDAFDWKTTQPRRYRPFKKGPHFMTMGIQTCSANDWLLLENTYETITELRAGIIDKNREHTVLVHPMAKDAVEEVYELCFRYMTDKYPRYFYVDEDPDYLVNGIKNVKIPRKAKVLETSDEMIRTLARNIEEDFLILIFDEETQQYYLRAGSFAFPSGFDPAVKLNLALKDIHGPVPLYKEKIEKSMDRFKWVSGFRDSIGAFRPIANCMRRR